LKKLGEETMIQSIRLQNFQNHVDNTLTISDGVNALVGATDSGKTAIIRAIRWVVFNRPSVTQFINHDAIKDGKQIKPVKVTITTDKHVVIRESSATTNSYTLDGTVYNAVNKDVPEEVIQALDFNELNIQFQMDSPFLLTETSGEVARTLNKIVKLEDIDYTLRNIESYRRKLLRNKEGLALQVKELNTQIQEIQLEEITGTLELAEMLEERQDILQKRVSDLRESIQQLYTIEEVLATEQLITQVSDLLDTLIRTATTLNSIQDKVDSLSYLITMYGDVDEYIESHVWLYSIHIDAIDELFYMVQDYKRAITSLRVIQNEYNTIKDPSIAVIDVFDIDEAYNSLLSLQKQLSDLEVYLDAIDGLMSTTASLEQDIQDMEHMLGDTCPLCGSKL
jgi:DNA repair exonuclease SbcCD ATPase subunit